ncbi:RNA polymerase sigma factor [Ruminococcus sp.]
MFRYCLSRTNSYSDAEDLAQEILLISCKGENSFPNEKAFYAFVWRTAENILRQWYRDKNRRDTAELDETISDGSWEALEEQAAENDQLRLITRELSHLNSNYRHVIVAHYVDGLSVKDISERFSLSQSMVKYLLFQSRKRIREGINMERNYGKLSYQPIKLSLFFWGGKNNYYGKFDTKLCQNILMACYFDRLNEEQISLQLGVPTAYLEDDIKELVKYDLLNEKSGLYLTNVPIITHEVFDDLARENKQVLMDITERLKNGLDGILDNVRKIGFYGSDMPNNSLKWMLVSLILRMSYMCMVHVESDLELDYPTDIFGDSCFRFFIEDDNAELCGSFDTGISDYNVREDDCAIAFWDVEINGRPLHKEINETRAKMLMTLTERQPQNENEKLVCAELVELGFAFREGNEIKLNIPCIKDDQWKKLIGYLGKIPDDIVDSAMDRVDVIRKVLREHTPAHLIDYTDKMAVLLYYKEVKQIMLSLCESGWLLPMKDGMIGTTVMLLE